MSAAFFFEDRAGILGDFITAAAAEELLAAHECKGDLAEGFEYCTTNGDGLRLVPVRVTPVDVAQVPPDVLARLTHLTEGL